MGVILYRNNWGTLVIFVWWLVLFRWSWKTGRTVVDKSYYMHCTNTAKLQDKNVCHSMVVVKRANFVLTPPPPVANHFVRHVEYLTLEACVTHRTNCAFSLEACVPLLKHAFCLYSVTELVRMMADTRELTTKAKPRHNLPQNNRRPTKEQQQQPTNKTTHQNRLFGTEWAKSIQRKRIKKTITTEQQPWNCNNK